MPAKKEATYDSIMRSLKAREFSPIYILMGEEAYYIDKITDYIAENVLTEDQKDFNQYVVFGADVTASQVADLAKRAPMMSEFQVIIVKEAQNIRSWEALEKYFKHPVASTILVFCYKNGTIDKRKSIFKSIDETKITVFESKKKRDYELPAFVESYLNARQVGIDKKSAQMIAEHIGADLNRLTSELDKVILSLPDNNRRLTPEIVEEQIGVSKDFNGFELRDALINRNVFKANQIIQYFDKNPKSGSIYGFLPLIFNYFQNLMIAYYAPNKTNEYELASFLGLRSSWGVKDYVAGMRTYTATKTMHIISKLREMDAKSKGLDNPNTGAGDLMKELIFFILH